MKCPKRKWGYRPQTALQMFVSAIDTTGGVFKEKSSGEFVCAADVEWVDLADAYLEACKELGIKPYKGVAQWL